jgi:hypothetical protein
MRCFYTGKNKKLFLRPWKDTRDQQHEEKCINDDHCTGNTKEKRKPSGGFTGPDLIQQIPV